MYEYTIENASLPLSAQDESKEVALFQEFYKHQAESKRINKPFNRIPEPFSLRVVMAGEIKCARNFTGQGIYIHYNINLPPCWRVDPALPDALLSGNTQISVGLIVEHQETETTEFRFSYPLNLSLLTNGIQLLTRS